MPFTFEKQSIEDVILVTPKVFGDNRGFFMETYKKSDFEANGIMGEFNQDNHSKSTKGVLRGLHYQEQPYSQAKIVRCLKGKIYDVAVDIRKGSPTYGKYFGVVLSEDNKKQFFIPKGFAHGYYVISGEAEFCYKCSDFYHPEDQDGIAWDDKDINISWPLKKDIKVILSKQDENRKSFKEYDKENNWLK